MPGRGAPGRREGAKDGTDTESSSPKAALPFHWHPRTNGFCPNPATTSTKDRANQAGAVAELHSEIQILTTNAFYGSLLITNGKPMIYEVQE